MALWFSTSTHHPPCGKCYIFETFRITLYVMIPYAEESKNVEARENYMLIKSFDF